MDEEVKNVTEEPSEGTTSDGYTQKDKDENKGMAILSYILPFIPYFTKKDSKWVEYHSKQGMNLLIVGIAYSVIYGILTSVIKVTTTDYMWGIPYTYTRTPVWLTLPLNLLSLGITILAIMGIVNVCKGVAKELPLVGKLKIFK